MSENLSRKLDLLISFDDTGSMSSVRRIVRNKINEFLQHLFNPAHDIDLRVSIICHNDYCDAPKHIMAMPFSQSSSEIEKFVALDSPCGGGDADECYELVMKTSLSMDWREDASKAVILIGDCNPHEQGYSYNHGSKNFKVDYSWRNLLPEFVEKGIKIYGCQALNRREATNFYTTISKNTGGVRVSLNQLADIQQYIFAILHKEAGTLDSYESSNKQFSTILSFRNLFANLRGSVLEMETSSSSPASFETLSKFQVIPVDRVCRIDEFVRDFGLTFKTGKGFYEWTQSEIIQGKKQIVFQNRETGEVIEDTRWCREQLGLPTDGVTQKTLSPRSVKDVSNKYRIFVQSTSYTRKMDPGTTFLYELEHR